MGKVEDWTLRQLNRDVVTLVLIAWQHGIAAKMAVVDRCDPIGFDMRVMDTSGSQQHLRVHYSGQRATSEAVKAEILALRSRASFPRLPWTFVTCVSVVMWVLMISAWLHLHDVHVLEQRVARFVGLHKEDVPASRVFLGYATLAILGANLVEALAVAYLARSRFFFGKKQTGAWFLLTVVAGYPVAQTMIQLKHIQAQSLLRDLSKAD